MTTVSYVSKKGMFDRTGMDALGYSDPKNDEILIRKGLDKKTEMKVRKHEFEHMRKGEEGPFLGGALSLAGSLIGGSKASESAERAAELSQFKPYNITSGLGSGTFQDQSGTATLSSPYQRQRDRYLSQSLGFGNQLNQFFAPTRDQFRTGTDTSGNRSRNDIYNDLLNSGQFSQSNPLSNRTIQALTRANAAVPRNLAEATAAFRATRGRDDPDLEFRTPQDLLDAINEGGSSNTDFDALNAEADRLFGNQGGAGIFDDAAYQEALNSWVSPEQRIYDRLFKMAEGNESLERSSLENRLFSQGMLGSTGGSHRTNALLDAQATKALGREQLAVQLAEDIQNQIQRRDLLANDAALGLDQASLDNLRLGGSVGTAGASAGANAGRFINQAGVGAGGAIANAFAGFGDSLDSGVFSSTPQQSSSSSFGGYTPGLFSGNTSGNYSFGIR